MDFLHVCLQCFTMTHPHIMLQFLLAKCEFDAESEAGGLQVMHISAASEVNNLLLPSLEMLRARPLALPQRKPLCLQCVLAKCTGSHQVCGTKICLKYHSMEALRARPKPLSICVGKL